MEQEMVSEHSRSAKERNECFFQVQTCIKWQVDTVYNTIIDEREATIHDQSMMFSLLQ